MYGKSELREDYQRIKRPVGAMARDLPDGHRISPHHHRRAQLIYGTTGAITVVTDYGTWTVPGNRGVWIPAGVTHAMSCAGAVRLRTLYIEHNAASDLPAEPTVVSISPLLRELIDDATRIPVDYLHGSRDATVMDLLLTELRPIPVTALHLTLPEDAELARLCRAIQDAPGRPWTAPYAADYLHIRTRTLHRSFSAAAGMSLRHWVREARLMHAVTLLARKTPISTIAVDLGYGSPGAFTAMFRRTLGSTPSAYFD